MENTELEGILYSKFSLTSYYLELQYEETWQLALIQIMMLYLCNTQKENKDKEGRDRMEGRGIKRKGREGRKERKGKKKVRKKIDLSEKC